MSSLQATTALAKNDSKASTFTTEGLPLDRTRSPTVEPLEKSRRIDCLPPPLFAAPSLRPFDFDSKSKRASPNPRRANASLRGSLRRSLIDDSEDELVDYFAGRDNRGRTGWTRPSPSGRSPAPGSPGNQGAQEHSWDVRENNVRALPSSSFYPLEKSSVFVPEVSANAIATRIEDVLRARSIASSYDAQNAKADCVSASGVFRLRLYRGVGDRGEDGIIVEAQRREGFDHNQDVDAVLVAAAGKATENCGEESTPASLKENENKSCSCYEDNDENFPEESQKIASLQLDSD